MRRPIAGYRARHPVPWAQVRPLAERIASRRLAGPPVLVLSMPRSGSSWVGATLGSAPDAAYLREPVTHVWSRSLVQPAVYEIDPDRPHHRYAAIASTAFAGLPDFPREVVADAAQWRAAQRRRRLVIKEVNPLALRWMMTAYRPVVLYLVRHPAAVAYSHVSQGWKVDGYDELFIGRRRDSGELRQSEVGDGVWARLGALQALALNDAYAAMPEAERLGIDLHVIRYEDLCSDPVTAFRSLFDLAGVRWSDAVASSLRAQPADAWRTSLDPADLAEVRRGYELFDPPLYRDDW